MRRCAILIAGCVGCVASDPVHWPEELTSYGGAYLISRQASGAVDARVVDPLQQWLISADHPELLLVGYPQGPAELGFLLDGQRLLLAGPEVPPSAQRPFPPGATVYHRQGGGWVKDERPTSIAGLRLVAPACPVFEDPRSVAMETNSDLAFLLPFGKDRVLAAAEGQSGHGQPPEFYEITTTDAIRRTDIQAQAMALLDAPLNSFLAANIDGVPWIITSGGALLQIALDGTVTQPLVPRKQKMRPIGFAGHREGSAPPEFFVLEGDVQPTRTSTEAAPAMLYHLRSGSDHWEAIPMPLPRRPAACEADRDWTPVPLYVPGPSEVRFGFDRGLIYRWRADQGFTTELLASNPDEYCRVAVEWSDPLHRSALVDRPHLLGLEGYSPRLLEEGSGGWAQLGDVDPAAKATQLLRAGPFLYVPLARGRLVPVRYFLNLEGTPEMSMCPSQFTAGGNANLLARSGALIVVSGGLHGSQTDLEVGLLPADAQ
ncbi:MAG: hypothetical protein U1E65_02110 [Myxococcota bacterium]